MNNCYNCNQEFIPIGEFEDMFCCQECYDTYFKISKLTEYDSLYIICPYCNYEHLDSYEYDESDDEFECENCSRQFTLEIEHTVTYISIPHKEELLDILVEEKNTL